MRTLPWLILATALLLAACGRLGAADPATGSDLALQRGFEHGIVIDVDGDDYYLAGPDDDDGYPDIPGHYWTLAGPDQLVGKHFNTGPSGARQWWSSDAPDGAFLYNVHAIVDGWSQELADAYAERGYIHYHELVAVDDGRLHPSKVVWLKHTARTFFTLDGGPHPEAPEHSVRPGVDLNFLPNGQTPYPPMDPSHAALRGKPNFTPQLYADGEAWGTKAAALLPEPRDANLQSFDKLFVIVNGTDGQLPVAEAAPRNPEYNGGRWITYTAWWTTEGIAAHDSVPVLTSYAELMMHQDLGHLDFERGSPEGGPPDHFECPLLPVK